MTYEVDRRGHDPFAPPPRQQHRTTTNAELGTTTLGGGRSDVPDNLNGLRKQELVDFAENLGVDTAGTRDDLIERINQAQDRTTP